MGSRTGGGQHVIIIGAGAAGTLAAAHLLRSGAPGDPPFSLSLVDSAPQAGRGVAYGTVDERHLLNVPAGRMSAYADAPGHFVRWLAERAGLRDASSEYVPRLQFGRYLADVLTEATLVAKPHVDLRYIRERAVGVRPAAMGVRVALRGGETLRGDALVLAPGNPPGQSSWAPQTLRESPAFVSAPWAAGALDALPQDTDLLLVGTGLTMVDVAIGAARPGRHVHAISRRALLPLPHAPAPVTAPPPVIDGLPDIASLRRAVLRHIAACRREHGDWRAGIDSLRTLTARLWQGLEPESQLTFLRDHLRMWDVHRHRIPPRTAAALGNIIASGLLSVGSGEVARAVQEGPGLLVTLTDGRSLHVGAVVDCTQPDPVVARSADPLLRSLLASGLAQAGPHGIGLATGPDGRLLSGGDGRKPPVWTLGPTRRGSLLETTAVPEIRAQAAEVAGAVAALLRAGASGRPPIPAAMPTPA
ncbi:FAD/NAD(P)-binding protein [Streptomyces olivaceoviridis]|uniref:FAD/NAD(P)-binding protein n=1 Tax=Streptomyces olivaceoviridis TaxID=1921 RepID=UPI0036F7BDA1